MVCRGLWRNACEYVRTGIATVLLLSLTLSCWSCASLEMRLRDSSFGHRFLLPVMPSGAVELQKTAYYAELWQQIEHCSGQSYPFAKIRLYMVPTTDAGFAFTDPMYRVRIDSLAGYALREFNLILLGSPWVVNEWVVRHEMLHIIASPDGHNPFYFGLYAEPADTVIVPGKCASLIICTHYCRRSYDPVTP